ncbi:hypothetical protein J7552_08855 [Wohlfahrtiimonas chitiniclastica]|uniref:hypothetical protein n=1 Tax=Wohlfahrtiimonas chitiniclastica TaxID=400946 RepID=UPI001BD0A1EA|nr:hypothetical protein [Wohlfahrtiimonas chitiniclastica]MBS7821391.1 hypothetical protein [Wohlfahrtiimonas chitiniclastica]
MRSKIKTLKVIYWYEAINWLGNFGTSYRMEQTFEPLSDLTKGTFFRNKWARYRQGLNTPSKKTVELVSQKTMIPEKILRHFFWDLLEKAQSANIEEMILKLDPYIAQLVYDFSPFGERKLKPLYKIDIKKLFLTIEKMPLDCLAILYIYWRKNHDSEVSCNRLGQECAKYLYYALLVMGGVNHYCTNNRIMELLYEWFDEHVILNTSWGKYYSCMNSNIFIENIFLLKNLTVLNMDDISRKSKKIPNCYSQHACDILFFGSMMAQYKVLSRKIRWGKWELGELSSELLQSMYFPPNYQRGFDILLMDSLGDYNNETYAHWLTLRLTLCGKFARLASEQ